jgi:hypothetical protein
MTKDSLMKSKKKGAFTGTKIVRISLIVGWINDLIAVVDKAVHEFEEWLDGARALYHQVSHEKTRDLVGRLRQAVAGFETVHDVVEGLSDSEKAENESETEDEDDEGETGEEEANPAASESTTPEPATSESATPGPAV